MDSNKGAHIDTIARSRVREPWVSCRLGEAEMLKTGSSFEGERIAKVLARAGVCSRRDAERLIADGRVAVDGRVLTSPALNVTDESIITVDGKPLRSADETRVWRYHKPVGTITSARDPRGRPTVFDDLPPGMPRVVSVGRLDFNTEGLLLLTNDGELARHLELPQNAWMRRYRVRVRGHIDPEKLASIASGVTISGIRYAPAKIEVEGNGEDGTSYWLAVTIHEGKNREVRRIMAYLGLQISRLVRVAYGPFLLGKLPCGGIEEIPQRVLRESLGRFFGEREEEADGGSPRARGDGKACGRKPHR